MITKKGEVLQVEREGYRPKKHKCTYCKDRGYIMKNKIKNLCENCDGPL